MAPWGGRTRDRRRNPRLLLGVRRRQKMSFGSVARRRRKPPAAGSHAEIRQPFICSTPACLEKYGVNALKCSFNRALRGFFGGFIFILFLILPWCESWRWQALSWERGVWGGVGRGLRRGGGLSGCASSPPRLFPGRGGRRRSETPRGLQAGGGNTWVPPPNFAMSRCCAGPCCRLGSSRTAARREITGPERGELAPPFRSAPGTGWDGRHHPGAVGTGCPGWGSPAGAEHHPGGVVVGSLVGEGHDGGRLPGTPFPVSRSVPIEAGGGGWPHSLLLGTAFTSGISDLSGFLKPKIEQNISFFNFFFFNVYFFPSQLFRCKYCRSVGSLLPLSERSCGRKILLRREGAAGEVRPALSRPPTGVCCSRHPPLHKNPSKQGCSAGGMLLASPLPALPTAFFFFPRGQRKIQEEK